MTWTPRHPQISQCCTYGSGQLPHVPTVFTILSTIKTGMRSRVESVVGRNGPQVAEPASAELAWPAYAIPDRWSNNVQENDDGPKRPELPRYTSWQKSKRPLGLVNRKRRWTVGSSDVPRSESWPADVIGCGDMGGGGKNALRLLDAVVSEGDRRRPLFVVFGMAPLLSSGSDWIGR